jgi:glycosyltransferase involved in cell wall biosynthesis
VRGALNQEFHSFEVVVSDNASEDNTAEILKEFSDERLVVIKQKSNIGQVGNFNACLAAARGIFFVVVCDDDFVYSHFLKRCGALVGGDADIPVIVALGDVVDGKRGARRPATISRHLKSGACNGTDILVEFLADRISPQLCTVVMKTESLRAIGGFQLTTRIWGT